MFYHLQDFEEMVSLAEKGAIKNVDLFGVDAKDELKGTDESGLYTAFPDYQTLYGLGKLSISKSRKPYQYILFQDLVIDKHIQCCFFSVNML